MSDIISKAKVQYDVEKHRGILSAQGLYAESNVLEHLLKKIESGAFDIPADAENAESFRQTWEDTFRDIDAQLDGEVSLEFRRVISEFIRLDEAHHQLITKLAEKEAEIERLRTETVSRHLFDVQHEYLREANLSIEKLQAQLDQALEALEWIRDAGTDYQSIVRARNALQSIRGGGGE